ncbi:MAG: 2TM domain-containing protein [Archaeoglobaceae archaeon]|nr:2TM domain-containing protein [Archaeoglobaceae archaeon]MDW8118158.1 2TM domain-containing protein [Archaeoglobaceae archaeon]
MISVEDFKQAWKEYEIEEAKRGFLVHLTAYMIINVFFAIVNYITSPNNPWFYWLLLGWGIGLAFHFVFSRERFVIPEWEKKASRVEMKAKEKKS